MNPTGLVSKRGKYVCYILRSRKSKNVHGNRGNLVVHENTEYIYVYMYSNYELIVIVYPSQLFHEIHFLAV